MRHPSAVLVAALLSAAALAPGCSEQAEPPRAAATSAASTGERVTLPSGVAYEDIKVGAGRVAKAGDTVNAHATGWLTDGTKFWSSHDGPNRPVDFALRNPGVIQGWVEGVPGMAVGGVRKLWIPSKLGYGSKGRPPIPPDADLVFEVELVAVR